MLAEIELSILNFIQEYLRGPLGDVVIPFITKLGDAGIIWILLAAGLLIYPKTRRLGAAVALSLILEALACNVILKPLVARTRPFDLVEISLLIPKPEDFSFPSGHTGAAFACVGGLYWAKSKLWIPTAVLGGLIAFSRLYLHVHFPTDVAAGIILGLISGWAANRILEWNRRRRGLK